MVQVKRPFEGFGAKVEIQFKSCHPIPVGASVLVDGLGRILLGQRANGLLECVGGKIENETVEEGAKRELFEEIGVAADGPGIYLGYTESAGCDPHTANQRFVNHLFYWPKWSGAPTRKEPEKCLSLEWYYPHLFMALVQSKIFTKGTGEFAKKFFDEFDTYKNVPYIWSNDKTVTDNILTTFHINKG